VATWKELGGPDVLERYRAVTRRWYAGELDAALPGGAESGRDVLARYLPALRTALAGTDEPAHLGTSASAVISASNTGSAGVSHHI
jgi:hypothetical protein